MNAAQPPGKAQRKWGLPIAALVALSVATVGYTLGQNAQAPTPN